MFVSVYSPEHLKYSVCELDFLIQPFSKVTFRPLELSKFLHSEHLGDGHRILQNPLI